MYIVTGLPRSGTSLMMQILKELGLHILEDTPRPDEHNPCGYFETTQVLSLNRDTTWLSNPLLQSNAIKILYPYIMALPIPLLQRSTIFLMSRNLVRVNASQVKFSRGEPLDPLALLHAFIHTQDFLAFNASYTLIDYDSLFDNPLPAYDAIAQALNISVDKVASSCTTCVKAQLRHER